MSEPVSTAESVPEQTPAVVAQLLDVVADHSLDHALSDLEQVIAQLRANAQEAQEARQVLRGTPSATLREAMELRASRIETIR